MHVYRPALHISCIMAIRVEARTSGFQSHVLSSVPHGSGRKYHLIYWLILFFLLFHQFQIYLVNINFNISNNFSLDILREKVFFFLIWIWKYWLIWGSCFLENSTLHITHIPPQDLKNYVPLETSLYSLLLHYRWQANRFCI